MPAGSSSCRPWSFLHRSALWNARTQPEWSRLLRRWMQAICKATGMSTDQLNKKLKEGGDLGDVATAERRKQTSLGSMFSKQKAPAAALTIKGVYE